MNRDDNITKWVFLNFKNFKKIDNLAYNKLSMIIDTIITNVFHNLQLILKTYPAKRITKKQFAIVLNIMNNKLSCQDNNKSEKETVSGGTVLPPAFFNPDNNVGYYEHVEQAPIPTHLSRAELKVYNDAVSDLLDVQSGGGSKVAEMIGVSLIDDKYIKQAFETFKRKNNFDATLSKDAELLIRMSIEKNIEMLLKDCGNGITLTGKKIYSILKAKPRKYVHLSCIASY